MSTEPLLRLIDVLAALAADDYLAEQAALQAEAGDSRAERPDLLALGEAA